MKIRGDTMSATIIISTTVALLASTSPSTVFAISGREPAIWGYSSMTWPSDLPAATLSALSTIILQIHFTLYSESTADAPTVKILITDLEKPRLAPKSTPSTRYRAAMAITPTDAYAPTVPLARAVVIYSKIFIFPVLPLVGLIIQ